MFSKVAVSVFVVGLNHREAGSSSWAGVKQRDSESPCGNRFLGKSLSFIVSGCDKSLVVVLCVKLQLKHGTLLSMNVKIDAVVAVPRIKVSDNLGQRMPLIVSDKTHEAAIYP